MMTSDVIAITTVSTYLWVLAVMILAQIARGLGREHRELNRLRRSIEQARRGDVLWDNLPHPDDL